MLCPTLGVHFTDLSPVPPNKLKYLQHKKTPILHTIVSYRLSTSNHNRWPVPSSNTGIVSYRLSTSNHNPYTALGAVNQLYLIVFLHQTTTQKGLTEAQTKLYLIVFLHQTTTERTITPTARQLYLIVFLHQTTTMTIQLNQMGVLYLIVFLHQTTTFVVTSITSPYCILSSFYIKPQPERCR